MMLLNAKKVGLTLVGALALVLAADGAARADTLRLSNPNGFNVYYQYALDSRAVTWSPVLTIEPGRANDFNAVELLPTPVWVKFYRGAEIRIMQVPAVAGAAYTVWNFRPIATGGVDLYPY